MGTATITAGGSDGLYTVTMDTGKAARDQALVRIIARMGTVATALANVQALVDEKQALEDAARATAEAAINDYVAATRAVPAAASALAGAKATLAALSNSPFATPAQRAAAQAAVTAFDAAHKAAQAYVKTALAAYTAAAVALVGAQRVTAEISLTLDFVKAEQAQLEKDLSYWQNVPVEQTLQAWCADLTEDATGAVATLEIPGESALVIIEPTAPAHVPATHGALTAREVQTPAQVFVNAAILPGWQKFKPTYRRGTITALNEAADTADVLLEATDTSSAQKLVINKTPTLEAVPVQYMACNSGAFEVGDRCVVKFTAQDWAQPKVVGFVDHPKSCAAVLACVPSSSAHRLGYTPPGQLGGSAYWLTPLKGAMPASLTPKTAGLGHPDVHPGTTTWCNPAIKIKNRPVVVSWRGDDHRYSRYNNWNHPNPPWEEGFVTYFGNNSSQWPDSAYVWVNGFRVATPVRKIIAAALYRPNPATQPERVVLRVCTDEFPLASGVRQLAFVDCEKAGPDPTLTLWDLCNFPTLVVTASQAGPLSNGPVARYIQQRPHYNRSATKIAAVFDDKDTLYLFAATVDVTSGALVKYFEPTLAYTYHQDYTETASYAGPAPSPYYPVWWHMVQINLVVHEHQYHTSQVIHGADFLGDDPVAIYTETTGGYNLAGDTTYIFNFDGTPDYADSETRTYRQTAGAVKLLHTRHGQLLEKNYGAPGGERNGTLGPYSTDNGVFLGDLSKDLFSFGVAKTNVTYERTGQIVTSYNPRYEYHFWARAAGAPTPSKLAGVLDGGYALDRPVEPTAVDIGPTQSVFDGSTLQTLIEGPVANPQTFSAVQDTAPTTGQTRRPIFAKYHQHGAVDPTGQVGYFGCGQYHQGMETVVRAKTSELLSVPAYAPGAYPVTLMAPVFLSTLKASPPPPP